MNETIIEITLAEGSAEQDWEKFKDYLFRWLRDQGVSWSVAHTTVDVLANINSTITPDELWEAVQKMAQVLC
jgi:hypothetical protein